MLSSNLAVRKAYKLALSDVQYLSTSVPVYWSQLPTKLAPGIYIVYGQIRNNDVSNKSAAVTETSVTVSIYTNALKYNDGVAVEVVANEVLNRIYKNQQFNVQIPGTFFQIINTQLTNDITNDFSEVNQNVYIDRILTFSHTIFQNPS